MALAAGATAGCADALDAPDAASLTSEVQGGTLDVSRAHDFAVLLTSVHGTSCSGTLIAPNLVLTARHCVMPKGWKDAVTCQDSFSEETAPVADLRVTTAPTLREASAVYGVREITIPADTAFCGNDIALVTLHANVPDAEARPATPLIQRPMTDRSLVGSKVAVVGYGVTEPARADSGMRRLREGVDIVCVPGDAAYDCDVGLARLVGSDREFMTAGFVCSGDSGGGAFEQASFRAGAPYVLGTLSRGPQTETECLAAIYTRTDAHAELISVAAQRAAALGGYPIPSWVAPEAELGTTSCIANICTAVAGAEPAPPAATGCAAAPGRASGGGAVALALAAVVARARRRRAG